MSVYTCTQSQNLKLVTILFMKKLILSFLLITTSTLAFSWGQTGHRATGLIAEQHLSKKAKAQLEKRLGHSLAIASTWMDEVRSDSTYDYMEDWHWVTIPDGSTYEQTEKNPKGDIIEAIDRMITSLKSKTLTPQQEVEHIKILIHLVGDIHQPLHVGRGDDRGGNSVKVKWFGHDSNLHRVWDSEMIDDTHLSYTELAMSVNIPSEKAIKSLQTSNVKQWAYESMTYRKNVYAIGDGKLSYAYPYYNFHIVRDQLMKAGLRIAGLLNEIYG